MIDIKTDLSKLSSVAKDLEEIAITLENSKPSEYGKVIEKLVPELRIRKEKLYRVYDHLASIVNSEE